MQHLDMFLTLDHVDLHRFTRNQISTFTLDATSPKVLHYQIGGFRLCRCDTNVHRAVRVLQ